MNAKNPDTSATSITKLQDLRVQMKQGLIERDGEIDAVLTALVAGEHCLLLGPTGTSKSGTAECVTKAFRAPLFQLMFSKFTTDVEVFGQWDLQRLKQSEYKRVTAGRLPEASFAFLDEIFKANRALLNSLLLALNEREFDDNGKRHKMPLKFVLGASNELPEGDEGGVSLAALYDRFLFRRWTRYIGDRDNRKRLLLMNGEPSDKVTVSLDGTDLDNLYAARKSVDYSGVADLLLDLHDGLTEAGLVVSDRRFRKCVKVVQASAVLNGRTVATAVDLMPLADCLWDEPEDYSKIYGILAKCVSPDLQAALALLDSATDEMRSASFDSLDLSDPAGLSTAARLNKTLERILTEAERLDQSGPAAEITEKIRSLRVSVADRVKVAIMGAW